MFVLEPWTVADEDRLKKAQTYKWSDVYFFIWRQF